MLENFRANVLKLHELEVKKDAVPMVFNFIMERCKPAIGQKKATKNKQIMPDEQRANSSVIF